MFQPQTMVCSVVPVTPSADPRRSSVHINNIETWTNDIIAPDEYQALLWDPQWVWVSCSSKHCEHWKALCMHCARYI